MLAVRKTSCWFSWNGRLTVREDRARQLRDRPAVVGVGRQALHEQRELIPGQPSDHGLARHGARQPLREHLEHAIARAVAEGVVHFLEAVHVQVQHRHHLAAAQRARDGLLQYVVELHAVRQLGERVVAGEVADAALGALALGDVARHEDIALELRVVAVDARTGEGHRNGLPAARAYHGLARFLRRLQQIEAGALALLEHGDNAAAEEFLVGVTQQLARRQVRKLDHPVGRGDEHRVRHAVQHAVEVALVNGGLPQPPAHALERLLQIPERVLAAHFDRARVVTLADPLGAPDEWRHGRDSSWVARQMRNAPSAPPRPAKAKAMRIVAR